MVIGNKSDLVDEAKVTAIEARKFCQQNGDMLYYEGSALSGSNVDEAFRALALQTVQRQLKINPSTGK